MNMWPQDHNEQNLLSSSRMMIAIVSYAHLTTVMHVIIVILPTREEKKYVRRLLWCNMSNS